MDICLPPPFPPPPLPDALIQYCKGGGEKSDPCHNGEELVLEQEASSHDAERLSAVNCCMAHAWCPDGRESSTKPSSPHALP